MKKFTLVTKILAIVAICLISFVGVYVQKGNKMENALKEFKLSKDLEGYREMTFEVHNHEDEASEEATTEEKASEETKSEEAKTEEVKSEETDKKEENSKSNLTAENYEKSKSIMQKRLEQMGIKDYNIAVNKEDGIIYLQVPEDDLADKVASNITQTGSVELKDSEDESKVLISSDKFSKAAIIYSSNGENGTSVGIELRFNKEGTEALKELSGNDYRTLSDEEKNATTNNNTTADNTTAEGNTTNTTSEGNTTTENKEVKQKEVAIYMSGEKVTTTSFDEVVQDGIIRLTIGSATTDEEQFKGYQLSAKIVSAILNNGILPVEYEIDENQYVKTDITAESIKTAMIVISAILGLASIFMIIKHKSKGLLAAIGYVGYIALYLLLLRYTNVVISLEGIVAGVICTVLEYIFLMKLLSIDLSNSKKFNKEYIKIIMKLIPILAISIIFCFVNVTVLESFGMVMLWGLVLTELYNWLVAKCLLN